MLFPKRTGLMSPVVQYENTEPFSNQIQETRFFRSRTYFKIYFYLMSLIMGAFD